MKILLLEENLEFSRITSDYLCSLGYEVDIVYDGVSACDKLLNNYYHLFICGIKVTLLNGFEIIKYVRNLNLNIPIMIVTSLIDINNMANGYELGCNEYLKKPFELAELKFRVAELIRKNYGIDAKSVVLLHDGYSYNSSKRYLSKSGESIELTTKELELVEYLIDRVDSYISISELREKVWEHKDVEEADIRMHILKIRGKTSSDFIVSKRRIGYKIESKK